MASQEPNPKSRSGWSSRAAFFAASVGSAVGLGNLWRFPSLCFKYGGGAFLLPYILGLLFIGVPILALEFALGQVFRSGDAHSFASINRRLAGVGVGSILCGFMVTCYYVIILAWAFVYFIHSFRTATTGEGYPQFVWSAHEGGAAGFLMGDVIGLANMTNWEDGSLNRSTSFVKDTFFALTLLWVLIYLCIFKGAKTTGRIAYFTMGIPFVLLVVFTILFGSMEGASDGVQKYLSFNFTKLAGDSPCGGSPCRDAWPAAVGQVFFSLSITFGVMTAYASYNPPDQGIMVNAMITSFSDFFVSIIAGLCVFTAVGVLAHITNTDVENQAGFGLVFISFPAAIEALGENGIGFGGRKLLAVLWFGTIVLLGIDSAFSLVEGFVTSLNDSRFFKSWTRESMTLVVCLVGYLIGLEYAVDTGLYALDSVDYYINVSMLFIGFMECVVAGWMYNYSEHIQKIGAEAWWTSLGSMVLACYYGPRAGLGYGGAEGTAIGLACGFFIFAIGHVVACSKAAEKQQKKVSRELVEDVLLFNIESLREKFNDAAGKSQGNLSIPFVWSLLIKFFIPPVLMLNLMMVFTSSTFGTYEGYHQWYQGWGIFIGALPWAAVAVNLLLPNVFDQLLPQEVDDTLPAILTTKEADKEVSKQV